MRRYRKLAVVLCLAVFVGLLSGCLRAKPKAAAVDLLFYGLDNSDVFDPLIGKYRAQHPNVKIRYKKYDDPSTFEQLITNEIAEGEGPDIFAVHNTSLVRQRKKLVPLQSETLTAANLTNTFVNVVAQDFIQPDPSDGNKKIYALPLYVDTLALYYNKSFFEQRIPERGKPAPTWDVFQQEAAKLRDEGPDGVLERGAIAMGRADNIRLAPDILANFWVQAGASFYDDAYKQIRIASDGTESFDEFMSYGLPKNKNYSWSKDFVDSDASLQEVDAFLGGKVVTIAGYSDLYPRLATDMKNVSKKNKAASINVKDVAVVPMPQISLDEAKFKVWARYDGLAVSRNSKNAEEAWNFIQFLTSQTSAKKYHEATKRPTARRDLIEEQKKEPVTDVFVSQVGYAASFPIFSETAFSQILKDAIQSVADGQSSSREALTKAQQRLNDVFKVEAPDGLYPKPVLKKK